MLRNKYRGEKLPLSPEILFQLENVICERLSEYENSDKHKNKALLDPDSTTDPGPKERRFILDLKDQNLIKTRNLEDLKISIHQLSESSSSDEKNLDSQIFHKSPKKQSIAVQTDNKNYDSEEEDKKRFPRSPQLSFASKKDSNGKTETCCYSCVRKRSDSDPEINVAMKPLKERLREIFFERKGFSDLENQIEKAFEGIEKEHQLLDCILVNIQEFCESIKSFFLKNQVHIIAMEDGKYRKFIPLKDQEPVYRKIVYRFYESWQELMRTKHEIDKVLKKFKEKRKTKFTISNYNVPSSHEKIFFAVVMNYSHIKRFMEFLLHELKHRKECLPKELIICNIIFFKMVDVIDMFNPTYFNRFMCKYCREKEDRPIITHKRKVELFKVTIEERNTNLETMNKKKKRKRKKKSQKKEEQELKEPKKKDSFEFLLEQFERKLEFQGSPKQRVNLNIPHNWADNLKKRLK